LDCSANRLSRVHASALWLFAHRVLLAFAVFFSASGSATTFDAPVLRVIDGDSLVVLIDGREVHVRLKEIDAPEVKQSFGNISRQSLVDLCAAKRARVVWTEKDRNGRLLARVVCSGIDANAEQVRRGMAWVFDRYVKDRSLYPLQDRARAQRLGLWTDAEPMPPWRWRETRGAVQYRAPR
jgi:endonuclease YncB( thermonuclease family)